jgi:hypothetical protein
MAARLALPSRPGAAKSEVMLAPLDQPREPILPPAIQPMATAPRDGTLPRLWLGADGSTIVGRYSDKWWGWIDYGDPWPLIRGDIRFLGWQPVDQAVHRNALFRRKPRRKRPPITYRAPTGRRTVTPPSDIASS